jgi:hypothetical protein
MKKVRTAAALAASAVLCACTVVPAAPVAVVRPAYAGPAYIYAAPPVVAYGYGYWGRPGWSYRTWGWHPAHGAWRASPHGWAGRRW